MAYLDLVSELTGTLPGLSVFLAQKHIQRAWQDIQNVRRWSFLMVDGSVVCPTMITTGTFNITQYGTTVVANAAASAALTPYIAGVPLLTQLQIRFGASNTTTAGQIYRIMEVDATDPAALVLTLDRMVVEATDTVAPFQCYRCYITPPQSNFKAWQSFVDMTYGFPLKLNYTSAQFDVVDPQRTAQGDAYYVGYFRTAGPYGDENTPDPNVNQGSPIYELWPAPTQGRTFYVRFQLKGIDFDTPETELPTLIDEELVLQRAYSRYSYPFAQANAQNFPTLKNANWGSMIQSSRAEYLDLLKAAKRNDDAQALSTVWQTGHGLRRGSDGVPFPVDANFIQSHLLNF